MEFWHVVGIFLSAILVGAALIYGLYPLIAVGFVLLAASAAWGLIAAGPGSSANPYKH